MHLGSSKGTHIPGFFSAYHWGPRVIVIRHIVNSYRSCDQALCKIVCPLAILGMHRCDKAIWIFFKLSKCLLYISHTLKGCHRSKSFFVPCRGILWYICKYCCRKHSAICSSSGVTKRSLF